MTELTITGCSRAQARAGARGLFARTMSRVWRMLRLALGVMIIALGILIAPLPGPFGLPLAVVGLMIVLRNSYWAKRQFIRAQQARPNWVYPFRRLMRRRPEFAPVIWQQMLRMERLVLRTESSRTLRRLRRTLRARSRPRPFWN
ncbi:MAG: hypothetical protein ACK4E3_11700 [Brevundimonas sp.]|jgi:hypothetical protein|uniref:hypothetical protein n=1 Tax=Brevundimonas sp. TaxID=1871086 RepID=UPI00391C9BA0